MGIGISNYRLANAVARCGCMGVVSGTVIDTVLIRRLQDNEVDQGLLDALADFPFPEVTERIMKQFHRPNGREGKPYKLLPMYQNGDNTEREQVLMLAAFCEVHRAKRGALGPIGMNLLTKIQLPTLPTIYGAMLAGVDYLLMGAGIPREIPGVLNRLALHLPAELKHDVSGAPAGSNEMITFDPAQHLAGRAMANLKRPKFLAIISSHVLAKLLSGRSLAENADGFIIEGPIAGGHNAPPRGRYERNARGEPIYGPRDVPNIVEIQAIGLPFWLAGGYGGPQQLQDALKQGAAGIQVGTLFALSRESGFTDQVKSALFRKILDGTVDIFTDERASPTGFPFKVVPVEGSLSEKAIYEARERVCDLGYLRTAFRKQDGSLGFRCAAEPDEQFQKKGGEAEEISGRKCLCNALLAAAGYAQVRAEGVELPLVTCGEQILEMREFISARPDGYSAADVIQYIAPALPHFVERHEQAATARV